MTLLSSSGSAIVTGSVVVTDWTLINPAALTSPGPLPVGTSIAVNAVMDQQDITSIETQTQHSVLGAKYDVILADALKGDTFGLDLDFLDELTYQRFVALRNLQSTLLLKGPYTRQWYCRLGGEFLPSLMNVAGVYRTVHVTITEQDVA